jgi:hypothetical protein
MADEYAVLTVIAPADQLKALQRAPVENVPGAFYALDVLDTDAFPVGFAAMAAYAMRGLVAAGREPPERLQPVEASLARLMKAQR